MAITNEYGHATSYFDAKSGLLRKSKRKMRKLGSDQEVDGEVLFGDYKEVGGVQFPHRISSYAEGKLVVELVVTSIEFLDKVDDKLFEKPKR